MICLFASVAVASGTGKGTDVLLAVGSGGLVGRLAGEATTAGIPVGSWNAAACVGAAPGARSTERPHARTMMAKTAIIAHMWYGDFVCMVPSLPLPQEKQEADSLPI